MATGQQHCIDIQFTNRRLQAKTCIDSPFTTTSDRLGVVAHFDMRRALLEQKAIAVLQITPQQFARHEVAERNRPALPVRTDMAAFIEPDGLGLAPLQKSPSGGLADRKGRRKRRELTRHGVEHQVIRLFGKVQTAAGCLRIEYLDAQPLRTGFATQTDQLFQNTEATRAHADDRDRTRLRFELPDRQFEPIKRTCLHVGHQRFDSKKNCGTGKALPSATACP